MGNRYGIPENTLQDKVRLLHVHDCVKHDLAAPGQSPEEYADERINRMTNAEFLEALSDAIEEIRA